MRRILVAFAVSMLAVCFSSQQSHAGMEYTFSVSNIGGTNTGNFGTIEVDDSTTLGTLTSAASFR